MVSGSRALQARFPVACAPPAARPGRALAGGYANRALTGARRFAAFMATIFRKAAIAAAHEVRDHA